MKTSEAAQVERVLRAALRVVRRTIDAQGFASWKAAMRSVGASEAAMSEALRVLAGTRKPEQKRITFRGVGGKRYRLRYDVNAGAQHWIVEPV